MRLSLHLPGCALILSFLRPAAASDASTLLLFLQLLVMRHAMVDMLLHPPPGAQDIVLQHFRLLRHRIASMVRRWVREAPGEELRCKLDEQAVRLLSLLAKL